MTPPTFDDATPVVLAHTALNSLSFIGMAAAALDVTWADLDDEQRAKIVREIERRAKSASDDLTMLLQLSLGHPDADVADGHPLDANNYEVQRS